ncbi:4892_t:CDS:2, partial [Gigaspora margarita]
IEKVFSMAQMRAEINYKCTIEAAKSLEQNILSNINTIFGSDDRKHKQINSDKLVEQGSSNVEQESPSVEKESPIIELETIENEEMIIDDDSDLSANEDINDEWKSVLKEWSEDLISEEESVNEVEGLFFEIEETEDLSSNELLVGLSHPADDPKGKWKLANLFDIGPERFQKKNSNLKENPEFITRIKRSIIEKEALDYRLETLKKQNIGNKIEQDVEIKIENKGDDLALRRHCLSDRVLEKCKHED